MQSNRLFNQLSAAQTPPPWSLMDVVIVLAALALTMLLLGPTLALFLTGGNLTAITPLVGWCIGLAITAAFTLFARRRTPEQFAALRLFTPTKLRVPLPYILLLAIGVMLMLDVIAAGGSSFRPVAALTGIGAGGAGDWFLGALFLVVIQPFAESLIFTGVVLPRLRATLSPAAGIVVTAAVFGVFHAAVYGASLSGMALFWFGIFLPLMQGIFLCCVRVYTDSTRAAIVAHVGMGLVALLAALALVG